ANADLSKSVSALKRRSASSVNARVGTRGASLWQDGFHDRALRRDEDLLTIARYVVANPLRAGLVQRLGDYPFWDAIWL
ncbi:MAG: transposase, partial [Casimicrobium sp.]